MGVGVPPFSVKKNLLKIDPKTVFFKAKMPFSAKNYKPLSVKGEGTPLFRYIFSVNFFWPATFRDAGRGMGGTPITDIFRDWVF